MPKEASTDILYQKLDGYSDPSLFDGQRGRALWDKLEDRLQQKKQRPMLLYYSAAGLLLLVTVGLTVKFAATKPARTTSYVKHAVEKKAQTSFTENATVGAAAVDKKVLPAGDKNAVTITGKKILPKCVLDLPDTHIAINTTNTVSSNDSSFLSPETAPLPNKAVTITLAKPALKVLHLNEIYYENEQRAREEKNNINARWMFTGKNYDRQDPLSEATEDNPSKKSRFTIPLQKSTNN